jgi:hypothetical protein
MIWLPPFATSVYSNVYRTGRRANANLWRQGRCRDINNRALVVGFSGCISVYLLRGNDIRALF